uniref:Uncharacterized protein n=1 Tax=Macaca mulatta TaxID=9544 RepID=A0A5F8AAA8_MACMU
QAQIYSSSCVGHVWVLVSCAHTNTQDKHPRGGRPSFLLPLGDWLTLKCRLLLSLADFLMDKIKDQRSHVSSFAPRLMYQSVLCQCLNTQHISPVRWELPFPQSPSVLSSLSSGLVILPSHSQRFRQSLFLPRPLVHSFSFSSLRCISSFELQHFFLRRMSDLQSFFQLVGGLRDGGRQAHSQSNSLASDSRGLHQNYASETHSPDVQTSPSESLSIVFCGLLESPSLHARPIPATQEAETETLQIYSLNIFDLYQLSRSAEKTGIAPGAVQEVFRVF